MFTRFGHVLLIIALLGATGAHWVLLQSVAWTTMIADNLRSCALADAVERTFDGKHPCHLCRQVAEGKNEEKRSEFTPGTKQLEFTHASAIFVFASPPLFWFTGETTALRESLTHAPPVPPPRSLPG